MATTKSKYFVDPETGLTVPKPKNGTFIDENGVERPMGDQPEFVKHKGRILEYSTHETHVMGGKARAKQRAERKTFYADFARELARKIKIDEKEMPVQEALVKKLFNVALKSKDSTAVSRAIEWAARFMGEMPAEKLEIHSSITPEDAAKFAEWQASLGIRPTPKEGE